MARNTAYMVFLLPLVAGIVLGAAVFAYASDEGYFLAESAHIPVMALFRSFDLMVFPILHGYVQISTFV